MPRVRYSTGCAGGCGNLLRHGTRAIKAHGRYWCDTCYEPHRAVCGACQTKSGVPVPSQTPEPHRQPLSLF